MNELIKITEKDGKQVVSARELHEFLIKDAKGGQIGEQFNHWIERKLEYGYTQNEDYITIQYDYLGNQISSQSENQHVRVHKRDYILTMDTAKEMAMTQNNDKGKQARKYFIECEKIAKDLQEINHKPMNELEMISFMALKLNNQKIEQERQSAMITVLTAKVDAMQQDYFSVQGYANLHKIKIDHATCNKLGRRASKISREDCAKIGKAKHQIYGEVNTYHEDILKDIFDEWLTN
jgi:phage anti-repressor protein